MSGAARAENRQDAPGAGTGARLARLLGASSVEVSARDDAAEWLCREHLSPGSVIYINFGPRDTYQGVVAMAARLARVGFVPVPHVAARALAGVTQLKDYLARAVGEAGVDQILAIAGDADTPAGPFAATRQLLMTGLFAQHGIRRIGFAGHPEPHRSVATPLLEAALGSKLALARATGHEAVIVSQFCFEAEPILAWLQRLRAQGIDAPVRIGLAGPASVATLAKFAVRCGIGHSIRALARGHSSLARLLVELGPDQVLASLAAALPADAAIDGLHFFTFGGIARTAVWLAAHRTDARPPR